VSFNNQFVDQLAAELTDSNIKPKAPPENFIDETDDTDCIICMMEPITTTLDPCGHRRMCQGCANKVIYYDYIGSLRAPEVVPGVR
jgi:hypothetical protein